MRIHRTTPTRAFSVFTNALIRDRSLSWCAVGVLTYLISLPDGARATIRSLAELRKEGRARIASALHELEDSRYLRRVVRQDPETRQFSTVYEVFDTPYEDEPPAGESEKIQDRASGESGDAAEGASPSGVNTGEEEPPSPPPAEPDPEPDPEPEQEQEQEQEPEPEPDPDPEPEPGQEPEPSERTVLAAKFLGSLGRTHPRLTLGAAEALRLAPLVEEWWDAGASSSQVRAALTEGLPVPVHSPRALIENRLRRKRPAPPTPVPGAAVDVGLRKPGAVAFRDAARRGGAVARALLRGQVAPA